MDIFKANHIHFIGINGIGISAIARMFALEGKKITGSDISESIVTDELRKFGVEITIGQKAENISADTDFVVYTLAIPENNPELLKARELGIKCITYPEALGEVTKGKFTIAICGTHGKTTTTAMIAKIMMDAGLDPTVVVGSFLKDQKSNFIAGKSRPARMNDDSRSGGYFVIEACEYRRSFLNYNPQIIVITNIDNDHLDYYKDMNDIVSAFKEFVAKVPSTGSIVCNTNLPYIKEAVAGTSADIVDFSDEPEVWKKLLVPGKHNVANAKATEAVAKILDIKSEVVAKSLGTFSGTWRRFEYKGKTESGAIVYDDYGHHPTEVRATLQGAKEMFSDKKIIAVFQPHLFSRTKILFNDFVGAFKDADEVIFTPIYAAREEFDPSVSSRMLAIEINKAGQGATAFETFEEIENYLKQNSDSSTLILTIGAGDVYKVGEKVIK